MATQVTPYLFSSDCTGHFSWLEKVFDAESQGIHYFKDSKRVMHMCISLGKNKIMMSDYKPGKTEKHTSDRGFAVSLEFEDGNGQMYWDKAVENGGKVEMNFEVQFWGSYFGSFVDPFGFMWFIVEQIPQGKETAEPNGDEKYEKYLEDGPTGPK